MSEKTNNGFFNEIFLEILHLMSEIEIKFERKLYCQLLEKSIFEDYIVNTEYIIDIIVATSSCIFGQKISLLLAYTPIYEPQKLGTL